ncbi:zinc finger protein 595-like [Branchiostoma floridae]|uniref:Zinc finger protein 595-like n=1 Tax=Branchiostoma floridae TaxID=7739 RepID=C3ZAX1_BRAFL|nr:zinc finger protein 595-like [Branchiostoma floridae]|eukprot:XP_002593997.1 hypothetical protein BRAFLDRAFT_68564 [Branchiostoma floridae]
MGDKKRRRVRRKKSKQARIARQALQLRRKILAGKVDRASTPTTRNDKLDTNAYQTETQLIKKSMAKDATGQIRIPDTGQTVKEEDDQKKRIGTVDINTTSQPSCGTIANDIKEEEVDELERSLVNCCNSTAQLLSCDPIGTDAEKGDEEEMKLDDCYSTKTPSLSGCCTVGIQDEMESGQDTNIDNCYNTTSQFTEAKEGEDQLEDDFEESERESSKNKNKRRKSNSDRLEQTECRLQLERKQNGNKWKKKTSWVCKCKEKFTSKVSYFKHKLKAHPETCEYCGDKFHTRQRLNKHLMTHLPSRDKLDLKGNKLFLCDHCGKFFTNWNMKMHKLKLSEARPYKCDVENCKSSFREKRGLEMHVLSVHDRNRFHCPYEGCKKSFGVKSTMTSHYKVHTDERSHQCSYCGKMFRRSEHLRVHMRIHTGDNPFNCSLCNYSGRQYNSLRWHMKTYHPGNSNINKEDEKSNI